jgi:hypothetical protein
MDIYASQGNPPPPAGQPRAAGVKILITGVFPEGTRSRGQGTFDYTASSSWTRISRCTTATAAAATRSATPAMS